MPGSLGTRLNGVSVRTTRIWADHSPCTNSLVPRLSAWCGTFAMGFTGKNLTFTNVVNDTKTCTGEILEKYDLFL